MFSCSICWDAFSAEDAIYTTTCGHVYHVNCMTQWCRTNNNCPHCRKVHPSVLKIYPNFEGNDDPVGSSSSSSSRPSINPLLVQLQNLTDMFCDFRLKYAQQESRLDQQLKANIDQNITIQSLESRINELLAGLAEKNEELRELQQIQQNMASEQLQRNLQSQNRIFELESKIAEIETLAIDKEQQFQNLINSQNQRNLQSQNKIFDLELKNAAIESLARDKEQQFQNQIDSMQINLFDIQNKLRESQSREQLLQIINLDEISDSEEPCCSSSKAHIQKIGEISSNRSSSWKIDNSCFNYGKTDSKIKCDVTNSQESDTSETDPLQTVNELDSIIILDDDESLPLPEEVIIPDIDLKNLF